MAYSIFKSNGTAVTIADGVIDIAQFFNPTGGSTGNGLGIGLVGRNAVNYGAIVAQNFLQLTENFASSNPPAGASSLQGQMWFNTATSTMNVNIGADGTANWQPIATNSRGGTTPSVNPSGSPATGDIQTSGSVVSIYANGTWNQVFPAIYS